MRDDHVQLRDILSTYEILTLFVDDVKHLTPQQRDMRRQIISESPTNEELMFRWQSRKPRAEPGKASPTSRYHVIKRQTPPWADKAAIAAIYGECRFRNSGRARWHVDHIIPLQGVLISGLHVETNLRIIPARENVKKHNRHE